MRGAIVLAAFLFAPAAAGVTPLDAHRCDAMKAHHVLNEGAPVGCDRLAVVRFSYVDFIGARHDDGEIVVLDAVAPYVERIFATLHAQNFAIAKARPMEVYDGNDAAAMVDDNTSGFNHRTVQDSARLSLHAYGAAIDLNPVENPYLTRKDAIVTVAPPQATALNRREERPGKAPRSGLAEPAVDVFAENGFLVWGGDWDDPIDYQHFDIGRALAERLAALPPQEARAAFTAVVNAYLECIAQNSDISPAKRRKICVSRRQS